MVTIVPPTYLYNNSDDDNGGYGGFDPDLAKGFSLGMLIGVFIIVPYFAYLEYMDSPSKIYEKELKHGTEQILTAAHADAVNSAHTIDIDKYESVPQIVAKIDSARYARKITRFIKHSGTKFLGEEEIVTEKCNGLFVKISYDLTVDKNLIAKDEKFIRLSNGYKRAVEQLAVQRRISKQK